MGRMERVNERLHRELSSALERLLVGRVQGLVTITRVETAADLRTAQVYVSIFGNDQGQAQVLEVLHGLRGELQHLVGRNVALKYTPVLHFVIDEELAKADRLLRLLDQLDHPTDPPPKQP